MSLCKNSVIPSKNASPARTEGSRRETFNVTSTGFFDSLRSAQNDRALLLLPFLRAFRLFRLGLRCPAFCFRFSGFLFRRSLRGLSRLARFNLNFVRQH